MALIIETGSGLSNATSYITVAEARSYALARGVTLSADDATVEIQILKAMDYIESLGESFVGYRKWPTVTGTYEHEQALSWPRESVYIDRYYMNSEKIPPQLKNAVCQLCIEQQNGVDIMPNSTGNVIIKEVVGPLETEYSEATSNSSSPAPNLRQVMAILRPLLGGSYGTIYIQRS